MGSFVAFNYFLHLLGGYLGGRFLSYRSLFTISTLLQIIGCFVLVGLNLNSFYWGLAIFITGSGFNSIMINCMLTQLFQPEDLRRETAFLWNYSGMNLGFFIGLGIAGYFQIDLDYFLLFILTGLGNLIAFLVVLKNWRILQDMQTHLSEGASLRYLKAAVGVVIILILALLIRLLIEHARLSNELILIMGAMIVVLLIYLTLAQRKKTVRNRLIAFSILSLATLMFWALYQILPMAMTLFVEWNVNRVLFGKLIPPQWFQNIVSIIIMVGGPIVAFYIKRLRKRGYNINIPFLFSIALVLIGVAMAVLPLGIHFANAKGYTSVGWIVLCYTLLSLGELCISPIGYSMVGLLAPTRLRGVLMGVTLMLSGLAATFSSYVSVAALGHSRIMNPLVTNKSFSNTFSIAGWTAIAGGMGLFLLVPYLLKLMKGER